MFKFFQQASPKVRQQHKATEIIYLSFLFRTKKLNKIHKIVTKRAGYIIKGSTVSPYFAMNGCIKNVSCFF